MNSHERHLPPLPGEDEGLTAHFQHSSRARRTRGCWLYAVETAVSSRLDCDAGYVRRFGVSLLVKPYPLMVLDEESETPSSFLVIVCFWRLSEPTIPDARLTEIARAHRALHTYASNSSKNPSDLLEKLKDTGSLMF